MFTPLLLSLISIWFHTPNSDVEIKAQVAKTEHQKEIGLQNATSLELHEGMLFCYEREGRYPFWMDKTQMPLAQVFINKNFQIVDIKFGVPHSRKLIVGSMPYQYVVELNPESIDKFKIQKGQTISLSKDDVSS